jgi:hypothetical protein
MSGGGSISPEPDGADCAEARGMLAGAALVAACACATGGAEAGLAADAIAPCRAGLLLAHPISGTDKKLAAVNPKPCCKKSLRDAMVLPVKNDMDTIAYAEGK